MATPPHDATPQAYCRRCLSQLNEAHAGLVCKRSSGKALEARFERLQGPKEPRVSPGHCYQETGEGPITEHCDSSCGGRLVLRSSSIRWGPVRRWEGGQSASWGARRGQGTQRQRKVPYLTSMHTIHSPMLCQHLPLSLRHQWQERLSFSPRKPINQSSSSSSWNKRYRWWLVEFGPFYVIDDATPPPSCTCNQLPRHSCCPTTRRS